MPGVKSKTKATDSESVENLREARLEFDKIMMVPQITSAKIKKFSEPKLRKESTEAILLSYSVNKMLTPEIKESVKNMNLDQLAQMLNHLSDIYTKAFSEDGRTKKERENVIKIFNKSLLSSVDKVLNSKPQARRDPMPRVLQSPKEVFGEIRREGYGMGLPYR